ncbi:hypothetical protein RND71_026172 [Anisodus tanguticus]|uniref:Uncharacterized protein n=1 Tax=Anisodus tanguticus TaxID=243964 RepID=A0AAE1V2M0_9SOLA|nr:hypothetical protein RND71_026172 [Anisodus tanguticus]
MDCVGGQIDYYDYRKRDENYIIHMRQCMKKLNVDDRKNETRRSRAVCKVPSCKWFIYASKANQDEPFSIKTIGHDHNCGNQRDNTTIDSGFLTKNHQEEVQQQLRIEGPSAESSNATEASTPNVSNFISESQASMQSSSSFVTKQTIIVIGHKKKKMKKLPPEVHGA